MASNQMQLTRAADDTSELRDDRTVRTGTIGTAYNAEEVDEQIRHAREALALCSDHKEIMMDAYSILAGLLCLRSQHEDDVRSVEEAISMQRQALTLCPERNRNRMVSCGNLAVSLKTHYKRLGDIRFLNEAIDLEREALTLCPTTVHHRWAFCSNLAVSLETYCEYTSDVRFLDEAISLHREALDICLDHGLGQAYSYGNLAISLMKLYQRTDDPRLLDEAIDLGRKNFHLCPVGDPNRLSACQNLALSLKSLYERTANDHLMAEIMGLEHEALSLCSEENLDDSFHNLACSCEMHYQRTGNVQALDAAIHLARQVLDQCRPRDPKGSSFCTHLSSLLNMRFNITGDVLLLNEAIDFQRVAFIISSEGGSSEGGPDYPWSCTNMADLLMNRHRVTGDLRLLDEAVALAREALSLCPKGHPYRSASCHSLAISLWMCYDRSRDRKCLDEAIDLERESFDIDSAKYPNKSSSVANLATFLSQRYKHTGDINIINEAINLQRKALDTVPEGHPERASYCGNLTSVLCIYYDGCGDEALLHEIHALEQEAVTIAPVRSVWSHLCYLAWVHLHKNSSFYDVNKAISYLSRSLEKEHDDIVEVLLQVRPLLDCLWTCHAEEKHIKLTPIYLRVVNLLPPLVHPVIRVQSQLSSMGQCNTIGSDAFVNAALAGNAVLGLENLELVQGVIWSQGLHRRDPQLADVPEPLAHRLQELLQNLKIGLPLLKEPILSSRYESLHFYSAQLHVLVSEIRALPGLERFMLGETFETLRIVASTHPVVVLVSARNHFYAFIITASQPQRHLLLPLDLTDEDLQSISYISGSTTAFRAAVETEDTGSELERGMNKTLSTHSGPLDRQLITLWHKIVKPVLDCLGFEVSEQTASTL
jgi:tetratricopeptide (TPR) repeat protein